MSNVLSEGQSQADNRRLRRRAEDKLKKELSIKNASQLQEAGQRLYDLRLDQIEIELLSDEFNKLRQKVAGNGHHHPAQATPTHGYFILDREGGICDARFAATRPSDANGRRWLRHFMSECVATDKRIIYLDFLREVFASGEKKSCELTFDLASGKRFGLKLPLFASVNALADDEKRFCLLAVDDVSVYKIAERKREQAALLRNQQVIETAMDGFWVMDAQGTLEEVNEAYARMTGYTRKELVGMHIRQMEVCEQAEDIKVLIDNIVAQGYDRYETRHRRKDGSVFDIEVSMTFLPDSKEIFVFGHDITRRKQAEQALRVAAATFETHDAILITDAQSNIIRVNRAFTKLTGYAAEEVIGKNPRILSSGREDKMFYAAMWRHLQEHGSWAGEIWDKRKNGEVYLKWSTITAVKNEHGEITQYVAIFSDITERKQLEEEVRQLAFYDALTKLPNRRLLNDRLSQTMSASKRNGCYGAVMFLDLDNFKPLNDTYGHGAGDSLLIEAADRLQNCVRRMDTVARFGGDEFVVILSDLNADKTESISQAEIIAEKIRSALSKPYRLTIKHAGRADTTIEHGCTASIGVVVFINHDESPDDILKWADMALYQAKDAGRNAIRFYDFEDLSYHNHQLLRPTPATLNPPYALCGDGSN